TRGEATAFAMVGNPNGEAVSYDWRGSSAEIVAAAVADSLQTEALRFDSSVLAAGRYELKVKATRQGRVAMSTLLVKVLTPEQVQENVLDSDGDGVIDEFDNALNAATNPLMQNKLQIERGIEDRYTLDSDAGIKLRLGAYARTANGNQAQIDKAMLSAPLSFKAVDGEVHDYVVDFEATGLPAAGSSIRVVLPLKRALTERAAYMKYHAALGWVPFIEDPANRLFSAPGSDGVCPAADSSAYRLGLNTGDRCVMLEIEDGGPNDADRLNADGSVTEDRGLNGMVVDPGTVVYDTDVQTEAARNLDFSVEAGLAGSGALGWLALVAGLIAWRYRKQWVARN
ncbi:MAG: hypothetical protein HWE20_01660, partial [Gammaproteobacteria bacterium]|nr:hypothetical protein [Gammaproteobacteria bacterium]